MTFMCTILEAKKGQPVNLNQTTDSKKLATNENYFSNIMMTFAKIFPRLQII